MPDALVPNTPQVAPVERSSTAPAVGVRPGAVEQVEQLWGSVFFSVDRQAPRSIVVTAAEPREGTTEVAIALALVGTSSRHGRRIALVDFNLREPAIARVLHLPGAPGVAELINNQAPSGKAGSCLNDGRLTVIPAGQGKATADNVLNPEHVRGLLGRLLETHDHVIIDAPAVNRQATAQTLAGLTDGVLLVTRAGQTRREAVAEAKKRIELARGKVLGLVLNMRKYPVPGFLYRRM